jgi:beta-galactosidase
MLYCGTWYAPEKWSLDETKRHIRHMKKASINLVCLGGGAWSHLEADFGHFTFDWLDDVLTAFHEEDIAIVLASPTASPPPWIHTRHTDVSFVDASGRHRGPGGRGHCCRHSSEYLMLADAILREMAQRYATAGGVLGWITDPSLGRYDSVRNYSEHALKAFREWLIERYDSIEELNEAWGGESWGFSFRQWNEIPLPKTSPTGINPGHALDFARFSSEVHIAFHERQYEIIKGANPHHLVGCVAAGRMAELNPSALGDKADFVAWVSGQEAPHHPRERAYELEITRSLGAPLWALELGSGSSSLADGVLTTQLDRGALRKQAWQAVGNGAQAVAFSRWRSASGGPDQHLPGIVHHDGKPRRRYREVRKTADEFIKLSSSLEDAPQRVKVALIRDAETLWSFDGMPVAPGFSYEAHCYAVYSAVKRSGHQCDIVGREADLSGYKCVVAPSLAVIEPEQVESLSKFVDEGGTLVFTPQSGTRTSAGAMTPLSPPGHLEALIGATVDEGYPLPDGDELQVSFARGEFIAEVCGVTSWAEVLKPSAAEIIAEIRRGQATGKPVITRNARGNGSVYYIGAYLPEDMLNRFLASVLPEFPIRDIPDGLEVMVRRSDRGQYFFLINHSDDTLTVMIPKKYRDLLSDERVGPKLKVSPNGVVILKASV